MKATTLCFTAAILASLFIQSTASAEAQQYVIKQSSPSVGSSIKKPILMVGSIPLDRPYAQLSAEDKNALRALYEKMGDNDEPPFPVRGLRPMYEALGRVHEQLELAYHGPVTLYVDVDSQGQPGNMSVVESPDQQISQAAANIIAQQKFKPAVCNGTPCAMRFVFHAELVGTDTQNLKSGNPATGVQIKTGG